MHDDTQIRDQKLLEALLPYARKTKRKTLTQIEIKHATRNSSVALVLLPEWSPKMPPFALARLSAVTKNAGYKTYAFDVNIESWNASKNWNLDFDPWHDVYWNRWIHEEEFNKYLRPHLNKLLDEFIEKMIQLNPTVVGFTMYDANKLSIQYVTGKLKQALPNLYVMLGGPSCNKALDIKTFQHLYHADFIISGEGEELILTALEEIEAGRRPETTKLLVQDFRQRIDLDNIPMSDYNHFDNNLYQMPNAVAMEFSRGCIAKCVFCDETHFWKYRDRGALNALTEIKELNDSKGVDSIFFIDSLVNGNLKELRAFAKGVVAMGLKLNWTGWMRCDGRMDNEFLQDLALSGLKGMSYGVESGSNKVLADMNKQITREEVEQNFRDGAQYDIHSNAMIILGFPSEGYNDFFDSMALIYRIKKYNLAYVLCGLGLYIGDDNILGRNRQKYNVSTLDYEKSWILNDFTNSKVHRLVRVKAFNIFLDTIKNHRNDTFCHRPNIKNDYTLLTANSTEKPIEYETFDYNICKPNINPLADSLVNEIWPLLRLLWLSKGAYAMNLVFDSEKDTKEYGLFCAGLNFNAKIKFEINEEGEWSADFDYSYKQSENAWQYHYTSEVKTNVIIRIEALSDKNHFQTNLSRDKIIELESQHNNNYDFSFSYRFIDTGKW